MATLPLFEQPTPTGTIHGNAAIIARERQKSLMLRAWILSGLFFMALPGTLLGFLEPDGDQCASRSRHTSGRMDGRTRPRSNVWLDRQLHSWHWILFTTRAWAVGPSCASLLLRALDLRCRDAVVRKYLWMALARAPPGLRGI